MYFYFERVKGHFDLGTSFEFFQSYSDTSVVKCKYFETQMFKEKVNIKI